MRFDTAIGLNLSDRCSLAGVDEKERTTHQQQSAVIGAVLKVLEDEGPLIGDIQGTSTIGTGLSWPPESRITESDETRRIPVPIAWAALDHGDLNSIPEMTAGLAAVAQVLLEDVDLSASCAIVVPDTLSGRGRRALLQRFTGGWQPRLLWRPVAATLVWIERFGPSTRQAAGQNDSYGHVLALHLGLDALETTRVEIRRFKHERRKLILPARRLPKQRTPAASSTFLTPCCWPEQVALRLSDDNLAKAWNLMWCSPWVEQPSDHATNGFHPGERLDSLRSHTAGLVQRRIVPENQVDRQPIPVSSLESVRTRITGTPAEQEPELAAWAEHTRTLAKESNHIGTVITGSLANCLAKEGRLEAILQSLGIPELDRLVATSDIEPLSRGSAIFAKRIADGEPGYLDTLPKIETLITRRGEPQWLDLTAQEGKSDIDRFVIAGKRFDEVVPDQGLGVAKGEKGLHLTLWKEDEDFVKETKIELPKSVTEATPVQLRVLMDPGQGAPRLLVVPDDPSAFGGRAVEIDWEDRPSTNKTKEQALAEIPRTNPPTEPRLASLDAWQGRDFFFGGGGNTQETEFANVRSALEKFLETPHRSRAAVTSALSEIRGLLRSNDQAFLERATPSHATAFSSEGKIAKGAREPKLAVDFHGQLTTIIGANGSGPLRSDALRCAGYCSLRAASIQRDLVSSLRSDILPSAEELICIGNTFKTNRECRVFIEFIGKHLDTLNNNTMKAMARILQYREDALEDVESSTCAILADACREILEQEVRAGNAKYRFRHASLCIVYLLRRRRYDDHFMNPNAELATDIKKLFERTIEKFRRGRMNVVGGFVDLPRVTQTLIDYIDRRGRGRLTSLID